MRTSLNSPISLPLNEEAQQGGTNGAAEGVSQAALARGYTLEPEAEHATDAPPMPPVTEGFLSRPRGWDR